MTSTSGERSRSGRVTISDVARAAGVSVATVSKVINERYGVSPATNERVLAVIDELGYESSLIASSLRRKRTGVIGVLVAEFEPYSAELLKGISSGLEGTGYELMAHAGSTDVHSRSGWERRSLSRLGHTLIDGAIVVTPSMLITDQGGIPVVAIDPHTGPDGPATVDADNAHGARLATEHLLSLGHRRIGFLGGRPDLRSASLREDGYRAALTEAGLAADPDLMRVGGYRPDTAEAPAHELLRLPADQRPTAIFAANDLSALKVIEVAHSLGLDVPGDLSVIGFDNIPEAANGVPPLTTISQPLHEMGRAALQLLLAQLAGERVERHLRMPTELVVRASTA
ncbi:LacI family DNA-binding transcriptional regulator [Nocardioides sp. Kera G14]|uniref:LacI family DNA-binding transcriptional regulator n=1 Tax=Nocardioides sp. Kera G14 TaxID=2884264 RepID=UPI001D105332|nr:LacI family DNA-binding transcriptional regulator [Nocardioides sp. Kera G14]UDY24947.1 LacI family transcriptional regulator [Nocardioides sp. Kera G14]